MVKAALRWPSRGSRSIYGHALDHERMSEYCDSANYSCWSSVRRRRRSLVAGICDGHGQETALQSCNRVRRCDDGEGRSSQVFVMDAVMTMSSMRGPANRVRRCDDGEGRSSQVFVMDAVIDNVVNARSCKSSSSVRRRRRSLVAGVRASREVLYRRMRGVV
jgi:hypothetical protein